MVLLRHLSAWSQSRRDAAIPLCRRRDRRRGVSLESDLAGAGGWRRFGGVRRRSRQMVARPVRAGAVRRLLRLDPCAVSRVGCPAVFRRAAAAGDTGVGRRWPAVARDCHGAVVHRSGGGGDDRLWRHVTGDDCDADRDARLRARICRCRFCHPVALARHVRSELCHRPPDQPPRVDADMLTGAVLLLLCSLINLSGLATFNFWAANVALGVGWNFLFVGATTLLTRTY